MQINTLSDAIVESLAWMLIHSTWQICLFGIVLFMIYRFANSKDHTLKYWSALSALGLSALGAIATFLYYFSQASMEYQQVIVMSSGQDGLAPTMKNATAEQSLLSSLSDSVINHNDVIVLLWLLGAVVLFAKFLLSIVSTYRIKQSLIPISNPAILALTKQAEAQLHLKANYQICKTELLKSAAVFGWIKPIIILPICMINALNEQELKLIIAHEMAHIKRYDFIINICQNIVEIVFYYHPIIWWMSNIINEEREICCDELAVKQTDNQISYARTLIKLQELNLVQTKTALVNFSGKKNQFKNRILNILNQPINTDITMERLIAFLGILVISLSFTTLSYTKDLIIELCTDEESSITLVADSSIDAILEYDKPLLTGSIVEHIYPSLLEVIPPLSTSTLDTLPLKDKKVIVIEMDEDDINRDDIMQKVRIALDGESDIDSILDGDLIIGTSNNTVSIFRDYDYNDEAAKIAIKQLGRDQEEMAIEIERMLQDIKKEEAQIIAKAMQNIRIDIDEDELRKTITIEMDDLAADLSAMKDDLKKNQSIIVSQLHDQHRLWDIDDLDIDIDDWSTDDISADFEQQLLDDGLINDPSKYIFELKNKSLRVNGKQQSDDMLNKYKALYEVLAGAKLRKRSKVIIHKNNGSRKSTYNNVKISR